uniref:Mediator of RNA polymerase II transcription subunit 31 n=1 Tax=Echinococcus granulosus TaxID=6210 RepID=A0A068WEG0_ECHGR|nr:hypothetical protein EgrG_000947800 [Echinococcus granulosus]
MPQANEVGPPLGTPDVLDLEYMLYSLAYTTQLHHKQSGSQ